MTTFDPTTDKIRFYEEMDQNMFQSVLVAILDRLGDYPVDWQKKKLFIGGEEDSVQTKFERKSNNCEIGVSAQSEVEGYTLLFFLRMIVDDNFPIAFCFLDDLIQGDGDCPDEECVSVDTTIDELIELFRQREVDYTDIYDMNTRVVRRELGYNTVIKKSPRQVQIWSRNKIRKHILRDDRFAPTTLD